MRSWLSDEQIIEVLREHDACATVAEACRRQGMSTVTFCAWKATFCETARLSEAPSIVSGEGRENGRNGQRPPQRQEG